MGRQTIHLQGRSLTLSNLDKVLFPASGVTKAGVLNFYRRVSPWLLPHLRARPLTLKRFPDGVDHEPFYEKRCPAHRPDWMSTAEVRHRGGKTLRYCSVVDLPGLMWVANMASVELHVLLSRGARPDRPAAVVFDLDPGPPAGLDQAGQIALRLRRILDGIGLRSLVKLSGRKGLHLYVPLNTPVTFEQTKTFARTVARRLESHYPDEVTSQMRKSDRPGKVFIDWSQNDEHKTTVCVYSLRAEDPPTVSAPVSWDELTAAVQAGRAGWLRFGPDQLAERLETLGDLFQPLLTTRQDLPGTARADLGVTATWTSRAGDAPAAKTAGEDAPSAASLAEYHAKRNFALTPEPSGAGDEPGRLDGVFVIQKHAARNLHYDLRLECDGVLKSWAVPKGPSVDPEQKRLAVEVEDHPLAYARFEGAIPRGEYGGGHVIVWDCGSYSVEDVGPGGRDRAVREGIEAGRLEVTLQGVKLQGKWLLVRSGQKSNDRPQWLLIKRHEGAARAAAEPTETEPYSPLSGLWVEDLAEAPAGSDR